MIVLELTTPGALLTHFSDREVRQKAHGLIFQLISCVADVAISLQLHQEAVQARTQFFDNYQTKKAGAEGRKRNIQVRLDRHPGEAFDETFERYDWRQEFYADEAERQVRAEEWASDHAPQGYAQGAVSMHFRSFVYALDGIIKCLEQLEKFPDTPREIHQIKQDFRETFPNLVHVRDSAHHVEDRVQRKSRRGEITPAPIENEFIHAPDGGVNITNSTFGDQYMATIVNGDLGSVEVSYSSASAAQSLVQRTLDVFEWSGPLVRHPIY